MKATLPALLFSTAVLGQLSNSSTIDTPAQADWGNLTAHFEKLSESFLDKALARIDEMAECAKEQGVEPSCTRENVVFRKE